MYWFQAIVDWENKGKRRKRKKEKEKRKKKKEKKEKEKRKKGKRKKKEKKKKGEMFEIVGVPSRLAQLAWSARYRTVHL